MADRVAAPPVQPVAQPAPPAPPVPVAPKAAAAMPTKPADAVHRTSTERGPAAWDNAEEGRDLVRPWKMNAWE